MKYNWQQRDWPHFRFNAENLEDNLFAFAEEAGIVAGMLKALPEWSQQEAIVNTMVAEAIKTSAIEGEQLNRPDVLSSIRNKLGFNTKQEFVKDKKARAAGELMVAVRNTFNEPLNEKTLFAWHTLLLKENKEIEVGKWRTHEEPMRIVSAVVGNPKVYFEAPPSKVVPVEMRRFIKWFNDTAPGGKMELKRAPVRAAIAHLYFESIHPFEDGNGRIGRAIAEKALSQTIGRPVLLSLSQIIEANKKDYYKALSTAQRSNDITGWLEYFVKTTLQAQIYAKKLINFTLNKARFFDRFKAELNSRQLKVINRMLDEGPKGFEGGMTAGKYVSIAKTSKATATRDLQVLQEIGTLSITGGGRSTRYMLNI